jgi:hypothetical protein
MTRKVRENSKTFMWVIAVLFASPLTQASAEQGDIVITRDVAPRSATRAPLLPDPDPRITNPGAVTVQATEELSDSDFATVSTGTALPGLTGTGSQVGTPLGLERLPSQHLPGMGSAHSRTGGSGANLSGQVNRSIQQGLRPLQQLGGR